jgi:hypothetical protein
MSRSAIASNPRLVTSRSFTFTILPVVATWRLSILLPYQIYTAMTDPTTQSNYLDVSTQHVVFNWHVQDFAIRVISGSATHDLIVRKDGVEEVM